MEIFADQKCHVCVAVAVSVVDCDAVLEWKKIIELAKKSTVCYFSPCIGLEKGGGDKLLKPYIQYIKYSLSHPYSFSMPITVKNQESLGTRLAIIIIIF